MARMAPAGRSGRAGDRQAGQTGKYDWEPQAGQLPWQDSWAAAGWETVNGPSWLERTTELGGLGGTGLQELLKSYHQLVMGSW